MALKVGELYGVLTIDRKGFDKGLSKGRMAFGKFAKVLKFGAIGIAVALAGIAIAAGKMAIDFQKDMANVHSLLGPGSESEMRIADLKEDVKSISKETGKSLDDLAGGLYQVVSAFGDTSDSSKILTIAAQASTAGLATTTDAVSLLSAVTKGYGNTTAKAVQKAADFAFQTVKLGQTDFPALAANMGKVIPVAAAMGIKQRELWAIMATLTGVTGNTSEVTTQLSGVMIAFQKPNTDMQKALKQLGFEGAKAGQKLVKKKGLVGALEALNKTGKAGEVGLAKLLGKAPALRASLSLLGGSADTFAEKYALMGNVGGATMDAFTIQQDTVAARWLRVKAAFSVMLVELGDKFLPVLESILDTILENMPAIEAVLGTIFGTIGEVIGLVAEFWSGVFAGDGDGDDIFTTIGKAITWLKEDILPPLRTAFEWISDKTMPILNAMFTAMGTAIGTVVGWFQTIIDTAGPDLTTLLEWLGDEVLPPLGDMFDRLATEWIPAMSEIFQTIADVTGPAIGKVLGFLAMVILPILKGAFYVIANVVVPAVEGAINGLAAIISGAGGTISGIATTIKNAWSGLKLFFTNLMDDIGSAIKKGINYFIDLWNDLDFEIPAFSINIPEFVIAEGWKGVPLVPDMPRLAIGPATSGVLFGGGGDLIPDVGRLAAGTDFWKGGFAKMGEMGPELAYLPRGAAVLTASETRALEAQRSGEGGVSIGTQNIHGIMPDEVERQTMRALRRNKLEKQLSGQS